MKNLVQLFLFFLAFAPLKAQITDSIPPVNQRVFMENLFANINTSPITSGILMEKGVVNVDFRDFDGTIAPETFSSYAKFRSVYGQLYYAHNDTTQTGMLTPDSLARLYRWHNGEKTTAIGLTLYDYHYFQAQADANDVPFFTMSNNQLFDNPNANGTPYAQSTVFMAGPHEAQTKSRFIFPSNLFFSNIPNTAQATVAVDFANGSGWQSVAFDQEYPINYSELGEKTIKVKLTTSSTTYQCAFKVNVTEAASGTETFALYDDFWDDPQSTAEAWILYGDGNNNEIRRPVIFVEGFDFLDELDEDDLFRIMNGEDGPFDPDGLVRELQTNGYDVIILNLLRRGGHSIPSNAQVLRRLINWVNAEKVANGSSHKNVVGGASMGGIIARCTLAKMEQDWCEDHNTELYISYDSPHQGVYLPLSMQFLLKTSNSLSLGLVPDVRERMDEIRSPAARQMFTAHIDNDGNPLPEHTLIYNELQNLGYPTQTRNIAVSLGNSSNNQPANNNGFDGVPYNAGDEIMQITGNGDCTWCSEVSSRNFSVVTNSNANVSSLKVVTYLWKWFGARTSTVLVRRSFNYQSVLERENVSGGYLRTHSETAIAVNEFLEESQATIPNNRLWHNLVSAPSAIDFASPQWVSTLNNETENQLVSDYDTPFDNILFDTNNRTSFHAGALQPNTTNFLVNEITQNNITGNPKFLKGFISNATYNFGNSDINKIPSVTIGTNGIIKINHSANTGYGDGPYAADTHFDAYTGSGVCGSVVVENGGQLIIGENSSKTANLFITDQTEVVIKNGGSLRIKDGSSLIVEDGGNLTFEDGASINLEGSLTELLIKGKLTVGSSATFTHTGDGKIIFNQQVYKDDGTGNMHLAFGDYMEIGNNAKLDLSGPSGVPPFNQKLVEVRKPVYFIDGNGNTFEEVDIRFGAVDLAPGALMYLYGKTDFHHVTINSTGPGKHQGIRVWNSNGAGALFSNCSFSNGKYGVMADWIGGGPALKIQNSNFNNNTTGIEVRGGNFQVTSNQFNNNLYAFTGTALSGTSTLGNCQITAGNIGRRGVWLSSQNGALVNISNSTIIDHSNASGNGIEMIGVDARITCSELRNNDIGIDYWDGILYLDEHAGNDFINNDIGILYNGNSSETGLYLLEGHNKFDLGTNGTWYITGITDGGGLLSTYHNATTINANFNEMPAQHSSATGWTIPVRFGINSSSNALGLHIPSNFRNATSCDNPILELEHPMLTPITLENGVGGAGPPTIGQFKSALTEAVGDITFDENQLNDLSAYLALMDLLEAPITNRDASYKALRNMAIGASMSALENAFQYAQLGHAEGGLVLNDVQRFITVLNQELDSLSDIDSNDYNAIFRYTLNKTQVYRVAGNYTEAIAVFNNYANWTFTNTQSMRSQYWQCICAAEKQLYDTIIGIEDFGYLTEQCDINFAGFNYKREEPVTQGTGIAFNPLLSKVSLYPKPVRQNLTVEFKGGFYGVSGYTILNSSGQLILQNEINWKGTSIEQLDLGALKPGLYLINLDFGDQGQKTFKITKE